MHNLFNTRLIVSLSAVSISVFLQTAAFADSNAAWSGVQPQAQTPRQEKMKYTPMLSYIPTYTGKNFINTESIHYTGLPTGECYNLKFFMREDSTTVLAWYMEALRQVGWTIDASAVTANTISASQKNGLNCFIYSRPSQRAGFASELILRYSVRPSTSI